MTTQEKQTIQDRLRQLNYEIDNDGSGVVDYFRFTYNPDGSLRHFITWRFFDYTSSSGTFFCKNPYGCEIHIDLGHCTQLYLSDVGLHCDDNFLVHPTYTPDQILVIADRLYLAATDLNIIINNPDDQAREARVIEELAAQA